MMMKKEDAKSTITGGIRKSEQASSSMILMVVKISRTEVIWGYMLESVPNLVRDSLPVRTSDLVLLVESEDAPTLLPVAEADPQLP
jgi:hypothetical protein